MLGISLSSGSSFASRGNAGTAYTYNSGWTSYTTMARFAADVDGDGRADIVGISSDVKVSLKLATGISFGSSTQWLATDIITTSLAIAPIFSGDFNCDGKADLILFAGSSQGVKVYLSGTDASYNNCQNPTCTLCRPGDSGCSRCLDQPVYNWGNGACECPKGSSLISGTGRCQSIYNYTILQVTASEDCSQYTIAATLPYDESSFYSTFHGTWSVQSNASDTTKLNGMVAVVNSETSLTLAIPFTYFEEYATYTFSVTRLLIEGTLTENSTTFTNTLFKPCPSTQTLYCSGMSSQCVDCTSGFSCQTPSRPYCNLPTMECWECGNDGQCSDYCNPTTHECVGCYQTSQCTDILRGNCYLTNFTCVPCLNDGHCSDGKLCYQQNCVECYSDNNCTGGQVCHNNKCVDCFQNSNCNKPLTPNYKCNTTSTKCQQCLSNGDCPLSSNLCYFGECHECYLNSHCQGKLSTQKCNVTKKSCVECLSNQDCREGNKIYCNLNSNTCGECISNDECVGTSTPLCDPSSFNCRECYLDSHCPPSGGRDGYCSPVSYKCKPKPFGFLFGPRKTTGDLDIDLAAIITTEALSPQYSWSVVSSSSNSAQKTALNSYLAQVSTSYITVSYAYLEAGVEYNFTLRYTDENGFILYLRQNILPVCPREKYLIIGQGCSGDCLKGCFECINPTSCITCAPFAELNSSTLQCDMFSYIRISSSELLSPKSNNLLNALIDPVEYGYMKFTFNWQLNSVVPPQNATLQNYLSDKKKYDLKLPGLYLTSDTDYILQASYINYIGQNVSALVPIKSGSNKIPAMQIDGGTYQYIQRKNNNTIKLISVDEQSYPSLSATWEKLSGPTVIADHPDSRTPMWLRIPSCAMREATIYQFRVIFLVNSLDSTNSIDFTLETLNDTISVDITNGNRAVAYNKPVTISGQVTYDTDCPDTNKNNLVYSWACNNLTNPSLPTCSDPSSLFGTPYSVPGLTIPTSYFKMGDSYEFTLSVKRGTVITQATTQIKISTLNVIDLEIKCLISTCTKYYSTETPLLLYANVPGQDATSISSLNFTWKITPDLTYISLANKFFTSSNNSNSGGQSLKITVTASNSTHQGECFITLKYNKPPTPGALAVNPSSGEALTTYFQMSSLDWLDEDSPLTYQYFYKIAANSDDSWKSMGDSRYYSDLTTILPANYPSQVVTIKVQVADFYSAYSTLQSSVTVINSASTLGEVQTKIQSIVSSTPTYDSSQLAKTMSLLSDQMQMVESNTLNGCPSCSGHGQCIKDSSICTCESGWQGNDCSVSNATLNDVLATKQSILNALSNDITSWTSPEINSMVLSSLRSLTLGTGFNNESTIQAVQDILDNKINVTSPDTKLTSSQKTDVVNVVSNIIAYKSASDCTCSTSACQNYSIKVEEYFNKIASDSMTIPNLANPVEEYSSPLYDYSIKQVSICDVESVELTQSTSKQKIKLKEKENKARDCSQIVAIRIFEFQDKNELFNCTFDKSSGTTKSKIGVSVTIIENNSDVSDDYFVVITNPNSKTCPGTCVSSQEGDILICNCPKSAEFDPSSQLQSIFSSSELGTILKIGALANWNPAGSPVFWTDAIIVIWFAASYILLDTPKLKSLDVEHMLANPTLKKVILYNFLTENKVLNIYFVNDVEMTKRMRLIIFFMNIILLGLFNAVFSSTSSGKSIVDMIVNLQILVILLPYWTMLPIVIITNLLVKKGFKENGKSGKTKRKIITLILGLITIASCLATFIIAVNKDISWEVGWIITIFINIFVQIFISPWIKVLFTLGIYYISVVKVSKPVEGLKLVKKNTQIYPMPDEMVKLRSKDEDVKKSREFVVDVETKSGDSLCSKPQSRQLNDDKAVITRKNIPRDMHENIANINNEADKFIDMENFATVRDNNEDALDKLFEVKK